MPTYWIKVAHSGYYIEANDIMKARAFAIEKYREQYPLRATLRNPAKSCFARLVDYNPIAVFEARTVNYK